MIQSWLQRLGICRSKQTVKISEKHIPSIIVCEKDLIYQKECCICLEEFNPNELIYCIPCGHYFHVHCLLEWKKQRPNCPMCETSIYDSGENKCKR